MQRLKGKIAVVTGASRSAGRGIALVLGEEGATVYVTGRSVRDEQTRPDLQPETTIEYTAELVNERGGLGIPVRCDHTVDEQVVALFEQINREQGRIDILVNNVWGGYEDSPAENNPFWTEPLWRWEKMFTAGVRAHFTASRYGVPLMLPQRQGLIVNTFSWFPMGDYMHVLLYDLSRHAIRRMVYGMALELRDYNIATLALAPGTLRNEGWISPEAMEKEYRLLTEKERDWPEDSYLWQTESPQHIGRAIAALAQDSDIMQKSGQVLMTGDVAIEYDFTDIDGRRIPPFGVPGEMITDNLYRPILNILLQMGGAVAAPEVFERIKSEISPVLEKYAQEDTTTEEPYWLKSVHLAWKNMVKKDWIISDSPQGTWEITETGKRWLATPTT